MCLGWSEFNLIKFFAFVDEELTVHIALFIVKDRAIWQTYEEELLLRLIIVRWKQCLHHFFSFNRTYNV